MAPKNLEIMTKIFLNFLGDYGVTIRVFLAPNNVGNKGLNIKFLAPKNLEIMT